LRLAGRLPTTFPPLFALVKQSSPPARSFGIAPEYSAPLTSNRSSVRRRLEEW
jgi:hypothetical protein